MAEHQLSKLTTAMVKPPLNPETGGYSTLHDKDRHLHRSSMQDLFNEDTLAVDQPEPRGFEPMSDLERNPGLEPFHMDRDALTTEFYRKLQDLKNEHQKTLNMLELLYADADTRCHQAKKYPTRIPLKEPPSKVTTNGMSGINLVRNNTEGVFLTEEEDSLATPDGESQNNGELDSQESEASVDSGPRRAIHFQQNRDQSISSRERNHSERVKQMWDNFNLRDYLPPASIDKIEEVKAKRTRPKSAPIKRDWSPVITIPKPFSMTVRQENKKEKSHTRSSDEVAKAERERLEREELALQMRVRAKDPPAHTYLPLYEEIMERQEQRSRMNRENAARALQHMVKPFSFMERERIKEQEKNKIKDLEKRKEKRKMKSMVQFVANPIPACVHDATVAEKMKEEQLYRKIKVKLRSEDLMRSSTLPPRMHSHELMYAERRKRRDRDIRKATKLSFRPETHDMPDFKVLHRRDHDKRSARKMEVETTMTEPFQLRTAALRQKKEAMRIANEKLQEEEESYRNSLKSLKNKKYTYCSDSIPTRMTESARLRINDTKRALAKAEEELLELKLKERERQERRKKMAQEVAARTMVSENDYANSSDYRRERLKQYQKQQKARQEEYQKELKNMNDRIKQRPLLVEQQAQNSARQKAEKRYKEILRNSGLGDDMFNESTGTRRANGVDTRSLDDYSDDEFDTSLIDSGPVLSKEVGKYNDDDDCGSDVEEEIQSQEEDVEEEHSRTSVKKHLDFDV